jgi:hypothetical protein
MSGLVFEVSTRAPVSAPERADIACFVGFVHHRPGAPVPLHLQQWLFEHGWSQQPAPWKAPVPERLATLEDVPVPIERWGDFARLFDWEGTYLGAAVRSFFAQGGRKCYVVRASQPWTPGANRQVRAPWLQKLLPGTDKNIQASPHERSTWHGAAHLLGLPDVSFLSLPDLAATLAVDAEALPLPVEPTPPPEVFVECTRDVSVIQERLGSTQAAPRCDETGYKQWAGFLERVKELLSLHVREVQLVAAIPLPQRGTSAWGAGQTRVAEENTYNFLLAVELFAKLESAFVQLVYPWVRTPGSALLPEELESPEGVLTGVLARSALLRGTFRSALNLELADVEALFPELDRSALTLRPPVGLGGTPARPWMERVSMLGLTATGPRVLSDVTTSRSESWRQAGVNRLFSVLIRALRRAGLELMFEPSGERTWRELVYRIEAVLIRLWEVGALRGASPREAFQVRCDRTTMTQDDLDNGRLVAEVGFDASVAIERIHVVLTVSEEGVVPLRQEGVA